MDLVDISKAFRIKADPYGLKKANKAVARAEKGARSSSANADRIAQRANKTLYGPMAKSDDLVDIYKAWSFKRSFRVAEKPPKKLRLKPGTPTMKQRVGAGVLAASSLAPVAGAPVISARTISHIEPSAVHAPAFGHGSTPKAPEGHGGGGGHSGGHAEHEPHVPEIETPKGRRRLAYSTAGSAPKYF